MIIGIAGNPLNVIKFLFDREVPWKFRLSVLAMGLVAWSAVIIACSHGPTPRQATQLKAQAREARFKECIKRKMKGYKISMQGAGPEFIAQYNANARECLREGER